MCGREIGFVKPAGVVYDDELIINRENSHLCKGLKSFDNEVGFRAAIGVLHYIMRTGFQTLGMHRVAIEVEDRVLHGKTHTDEIPAQHRRINRRWNANVNLRNVFYNIVRRIQIDRCVGPSLFCASVWINDLEFLKATQQEVLPWALGEYQ